MIRKLFAAATLVASAAFLPGVAQAATGFIIGRVEMRAGPDYDYPIVRPIGDGRSVYIYGCLSDWSWCDVSYRGDRGWVFSDYLLADYGGRRQRFVTVAPYLGLGFLSFSFGNYWDSYYRGRPFYSERGRWERRYHDRYNPRWDYRPDRRGSHDYRGAPDRRYDDRRHYNPPRQHQEMDRNRQQMQQQQQHQQQQRHQQNQQHQGRPDRDQQDRGDRGPR